MTNKFYSNGKLLLSGEYAILDGAKGWAIPTKYGQSLQWNASEKEGLHWSSLDYQGKVWFSVVFSINNITFSSTTHVPSAEELAKMLLVAKTLNPAFLTEHKGYTVETKMDFPRAWGLGSSSTLINNLAQWAQVDPYTLLEASFGGSGYDIACAQHNTPIMYWLTEDSRKIEARRSIIPMASELYFVYLNQKQNSRKAIGQYRSQSFNLNALVADITQLSEAMSQSETKQALDPLITAHEQRLSQVLGMQPVKDRLFADYSLGSIKSLGAWGGDFIMATGNEKTPEYFKSKGFDVVFTYDQMALTS